jgi:hypothetical protein
MEKLMTLILALFVFAVIASCNFGRQHTTIVENDNNHYMKIEYAGRVHFKSDGSGIESISRGGYVKYRYNERTFEARNDGHGGVLYKLYDGSDQLPLDQNGRAFIADAVKNMMKKGHNPGYSASN